MSSNTDTTGQLTTATLRWRRLVLLTAALSFVCIFGLNAYIGQSDKAGPFISAPLWLPYLFVLLRLRSKTAKSGLAPAIAMGCALFVPAIWFAWYALTWDARWWIPSTLAMTAALQAVMVATAMRVYRHLPAAPGDRSVLLWNCSYAIAVLSLLGLSSRNLPNRIAQNEEQAIWTLRVTNQAATEYAKAFGGIYPASLAALNAPPRDDQKPGCKAYNLRMLPLDDPNIGLAFRSNEYIFQYKVGAPAEIPAGGCAGARSYMLTARPLVYGKTGRRSFAINEAGAMRSTSENQYPL
jgi:hypothetical protein